MKVKKLFNLRPMVLIAVGVCLGITSAYFFYFNKIFLGVLICLLFCSLCSVVFLPWFKQFNIKSKILLITLMSVLFIFCGAVFGTTVYDFDNANLNSHYYKVSAKVIEAETTDYGKRLLLDNVRLDGVNGGKSKYKILVYVYGNCYNEVGDLITFDTKLDDLYSVYEYKFSADNVLRKIKYTAQIDSYQDKITTTGKSLTVFERINLFIRDTLKQSLDYTEFSIAYAMLTGHGEYMDYETVTTYRTAGVAHIFAVSGLHVGFLATALGFLFKKLKLNRLLSAIIISVSLFFYAGICGFSASSLRASIMATVAIFSAVRGNRYDGLSSLALSAVLILCFFPLQFFNVGFRLSFLVVLGIMALSRPMSAPFKFLPQKICSAIGVAMSAQIVSVALCLSTFGYFSPIAILVNIIFIPIASVVFTLLLITTVIGGLFSIGSVTLFIPNYILKFVNMCINAFDFEKLIIGDFTMGIFALFYYIALIFPSEQINLKTVTRIIATAVCLIVCAVGSVFVTVKENNATKIYVRGSDTICFTVIDTPDKNVLILSDVATSYSVYTLNVIAKKYKVDKLDDVIILDGFDCEIQQFITKLRTVFDIERICYYGKKNGVLEAIVKKSFGYKMDNYKDGQDMQIDGVKINFMSQGRMVNFIVGGKNCAVFSLTRQPFYEELCNTCDLMVCGIDQDITFAYYNPKRAISYRKSRVFTDADSRGTVIFNVD